MKKYQAWTLVEMVIAIIIITILSLVCLSNFKPNIQKTKVYIYAVMKNITSANMVIAEKYDDSLDDETYEGDNDWYCIHLADTFNLTTPVKCEKTLGKDTINMRLPNGVEIKGLTNEWLEAPSSEYYIKNILVDIDGFDKGLGKLWVDQFPLRIYNGSIYTGQVVPTNCADDGIDETSSDYTGSDDDVSTKPHSYKSPYCKGNTTNTAMDDTIITYDVYKAESADETSRAVLVASNLSLMEADCGAYGGSGIYKAKQCDSNARILPECATVQNCAICNASASDAAVDDGYDICPIEDSEGNTGKDCAEIAAFDNPDDINCFTLLHKPSAGTSFLLETLLTNIDE